MNPTYGCLVTGAGRAAVATIVLEGTLAAKCIQTRFHPATKSVQSLMTNKIYFGTWIWNDYEEELVVCRTHEHTFEIHCHGGQLAASTILRSCVDLGVTLLDHAQWSIFRGKNRFVAEAAEMLPRLQTERTVTIAMDQYRDQMVRALSQVRSLLQEDHPDRALQVVDQILSFSKLGLTLDRPFSVVLVGAPNTGKSSLVNAIVGFDRAIVFDQPGTTRDIVTADTALDGWPIRLTDTAGIRQTDDPIEQAGISLAKQQLASADLILSIIDMSSPAAARTPNFDQNQLTVGTKSDLLTSSIPNDLDVATSAEKQTGIDELCEKIVHRLVPKVPTPHQAIPLSRWQQSQLQTLSSLLQRGDRAGSNDLLSQLSPIDSVDID